MKTLSELNEKMWYRALKVIYIFFVGFCFLIATGSIVAAAYQIYDNHQDYSIRNERYQRNFTQEEFDKLETVEEREIANYGRVQGKNREEITDALNRYREDAQTQPTSTSVTKISDLEDYTIVARTNNSLFEKAPESPHTLLWSLGMLLFIPWCYFCAWLAMMIPRWIFYYVVLGTIRPPQ